MYLSWSIFCFNFTVKKTEGGGGEALTSEVGPLEKSGKG